VQIVEKSVEAMTKEELVSTLSGSFGIVGDIHGTLDALARIVDDFDNTDSQLFVFPGDFVDRRCESYEVIPFPLC
jgi:hypothetical protein